MVKRSLICAALTGLLGGLGVWRLAARSRPTRTAPRTPVPEAKRRGSGARVDLHGQVVIVTGASAGIGQAAARAFAAHGACLVLVARRAEVLDEVAAELTRDFAMPPATILSISADISRPDDLQRVIETTLRQFGQIDVLVNNAGVSLGGPLESQAEPALRQMIAVNVYGPIRLTQLALPVMLKQRRGHIVNVSSMIGLLEPPGATVYAATRAAIRSFSRALRRELAGTGVHVSTVFPGWTQTAMTDKLDRGKLRAAHFLGPLITIDAPATPAQAIVEAVRFRRNETLLGGPLLIVGGHLVGLSPRLIDLYYRRFSDRAAALEALRDLGA
jgi:short-subunit dehydrogenase